MLIVSMSFFVLLPFTLATGGWLYLILRIYPPYQQRIMSKIKC